jgi:GNAT superfamily N-acetyltransferase
MERFARYAAKFGIAHGLEEPPIAIALWLVPDALEITDERAEEAGRGELPARVGTEFYETWVRLRDELEPYHQESISGPHYLLALVAVEPGEQNLGRGASLLAPILARADAERLPCYLQTAQRRTLRFFRRLGFEVVREGDISNGGPHFWCMVRQPQTEPA